MRRSSHGQGQKRRDREIPGVPELAGRMTGFLVKRVVYPYIVIVIPQKNSDSSKKSAGDRQVIGTFKPK
jgi:hypothetical protein